MADYVDQWSARGVRASLVQPSRLSRYSPKAGAAGLHGSLGSRCSDHYLHRLRASLMLPNMYRLPASSSPGVFRQRTYRCSHALNIFGDHSDVMSARQTDTSRRERPGGYGSGSLLPRSNQGRFHLLASSTLPYFSRDSRKVAVWDYADLAGV